MYAFYFNLFKFFSNRNLAIKQCCFGVVFHCTCIAAVFIDQFPFFFFCCPLAITVKFGFLICSNLVCMYLIYDKNGILTNFKLQQNWVKTSSFHSCQMGNSIRFELIKQCVLTRFCLLKFYFLVN